MKSCDCQGVGHTPWCGSHASNATKRDAYISGQRDALTWLAVDASEDAPLAAFDASVQFRAALICLARNLATAGALCEAFRLGFDAGWNCSGKGFNAEYAPRQTDAGYNAMASDPDHDDLWRPGCGRSAP